jgi:hypothetical protein
MKIASNGRATPFHRRKIAKTYAISGDSINAACGR